MAWPMFKRIEHVLNTLWLMQIFFMLCLTFLAFGIEDQGWHCRSQIVDQGWHLQRIDLCSALCTRVLHLEQFYIHHVNNITWYNGLQMDGAQRPPASTANGGRGEGFSIPNLYSPNRVMLTWHNGLWLDLSKLVLGSLLLYSKDGSRIWHIWSSGITG